MKQLSDAYLSEAAVIEMESETETAHGIEQAVYNTGSEEKYQTLFRVLVREKPSDCMVFCGTREMVKCAVPEAVERRGGLRDDTR